MKTRDYNSESRSERGNIILGTMVLITLAAMIVAGTLAYTSSAARSQVAGKIRTRHYYAGEDTLAKGIAWLRQNSKELVSVFSRTNFYTVFDKSATPSVGSNDTSAFTVPTKIKLQGGSSSIILSNSATLASTNYPATTDPDTGTARAPSTDWAAGTYGSDMVRITLIDAQPVDATKDWGDPDSGNAAPQTDFNPIFRIDAMDSPTSGAHVFSYVVGNILFNYGTGFYGRDLIEMDQPCDSFLSNNGSYTAASKRPNCSIGSNGTVDIHQNTGVYGTASTNGSINTSSPFGGDLCSDFSSGCPNHGATCEGASCNVPGLPIYNSWTSYCPTNQGNLNISGTQTLTVSGNASAQKCWGTIATASNSTLTLTSTGYSYFIDTFNLANNSVINFAPSPANATINLYVKKFVGDSFNGNQVFNLNNKPYQLRIHYLGTDPLTLNGTAEMHAFIDAPYAPINVQGNFTYEGGIKATSLVATGSGALHYDESGDITTISDLQFTQRNMEERYR